MALSGVDVRARTEAAGAAAPVEKKRARKSADTSPPLPPGAKAKTSGAFYLDTLAPRPGSLALLGPDAVQAALQRLAALGVQVEEIGRSSGGRPISALRVGHGPLTLAAISGAHADEPLGTSTCLHLAEQLATQRALAPLLERVTVHLVPQANPDGSALNEPWFAPWTAAPDLRAYSAHVRRAGITHDVEFGFPRARGGAAAPENTAIARWFDGLGRIDHYASLHSMSVNGGAWFLVNAADLAGSMPTLRYLLDEAQRLGLPLHDEEGGGMFPHIALGLSGAPVTGGGAQNSMEYVRRFNACPLALVTEIPLCYSPHMASSRVLTGRAAEAERATVAALAEQAAQAAGVAAELATLELGPRGAERLVHLRFLVGKGHGPTALGATVREGDADYVKLNLERRTCAYLAVAASVLEDSPDPKAKKVAARLEKTLQGALRSFEAKLRFPSLETQSRLQIAAVLAPVLQERA